MLLGDTEVYCARAYALGVFICRQQGWYGGAKVAVLCYNLREEISRGALVFEHLTPLISRKVQLPMTIHYITLKQCTRKDKCVNPLGSWLPATLEYFRPSKRVKSGLSAQCIYCRRKASLDWVARNPEKNRESCRRWRAENPEAVQKNHRDYRAAHADETREYKRRYRAAHPEKDRERARRWQKAHPKETRARSQKWIAEHPDKVREHRHRRRALIRQATGTHTAADITLLVKQSKGRCWWCGNKITGKDWHLDHRIPLARGGSNAAENLCVSCPTCNLQKNDKLPQEWNGRLL